MSVSFNLIDHDWIPVVDQQLSPHVVSLRALLFQAHNLNAVSGETPLETVALLRLLLAMVYRIVDLPDEDAWAERWQAGNGQFPADEIDAYLMRPKIYPQFELFGAGPRFFQYQPDPKAGVKSVNSLMPHFAFGNKGTLFDHHRDDELLALTLDEAARALLVAQAFGLGGLSGLEEKFTDGPGSKGILFIIRGANLFQTLMLNLAPREFRSDQTDDRPIWEQPDPFADQRTMPNGVMDVLTWPNRRIWLETQEIAQSPRVTHMRWSPGLRLSEVYHDEPMKLYTVSKEYGIRPLVFSGQRALWRNSATIFQLAPTAQESKGQGPLATRMLAAIHHQSGYIEESKRYHLMAFGMVKDQASIDFVRFEEMPLRIEYLLHQGVLGQLQTELAFAETTYDDLNWAVMALARGILNPALTMKELLADPKPEERDRARALVQSWNVSSQYWSRLAEPFGIFVDRLPDDAATALTRWRERVRSAALRAFERAEELARPDDRSFRTISYARTLFFSRLNKRFEGTQNNEEVIAHE